MIQDRRCKSTAGGDNGGKASSSFVHSRSLSPFSVVLGPSPSTEWAWKKRVGVGLDVRERAGVGDSEGRREGAGVSILVSMHSVLLVVACVFDLDLDDGALVLPGALGDLDPLELDFDLNVNDLHPVGVAVLALDLPLPFPLPELVDGDMVMDNFLSFVFIIIWSWRPSSSRSETTGIASFAAKSPRHSPFPDIRGPPAQAASAQLLTTLGGKGSITETITSGVAFGTETAGDIAASDENTHCTTAGDDDATTAGGTPTAVTAATTGAAGETNDPEVDTIGAGVAGLDDWVQTQLSRKLTISWNCFTRATMSLSTASLSSRCPK